MTLPRYKKLYEEMVEKHSTDFKTLKTTPLGTDDFLSIQRKIQRIVGQYENALCGRMERNNRAQYSTALSEKFKNLVRENYPEFDYSETISQ